MQTFVTIVNSWFNLEHFETNKQLIQPCTFSNKHWFGCPQHKHVFIGGPRLGKGLEILIVSWASHGCRGNSKSHLAKLYEGFWPNSDKRIWNETYQSNVQWLGGALGNAIEIYILCRLTLSKVLVGQPLKRNRWEKQNETFPVLGDANSVDVIPQGLAWPLS